MSHTADEIDADAENVDQYDDYSVIVVDGVEQVVPRSDAPTCAKVSGGEVLEE